MIILGIDPGLATLGYGILDKDKGGNVRPLDYGVVLTPKEENLPVRLAMLEEGIAKILDKFTPDEVAVEELFFSKNVTTGIAVAHARGVALLTCVKRCGRLFEYTPMQIKQALTGYGKADKRQMQQVAQFKKLEKKKLDPDFDYSTVNSLRREAVQKLNLYKPASIGQASRISGVSPADISVLLVHLEQMRHSK